MGTNIQLQKAKKKQCTERQYGADTALQKTKKKGNG